MSYSDYYQVQGKADSGAKRIPNNVGFDGQTPSIQMLGSIQTQGYPSVVPTAQAVVTKEFEQPRFYSSSMMVQPPYTQVPSTSPYTNQQIVYPTQQLYYEIIPVNNYLLIPNSNTGNVNMNAPTTYYNTSFYTPTNQFVSLAPGQQVTVQHQPHGMAQMAQPIHNLNLEKFAEKLQEVLPVPPLSKMPIRADMNINLNQKRTKRKTKFTKKQDELILSLKKEGKSWAEIAEFSGVGSFLAARNRYQVIVGQQGNNNSSSWNGEDTETLRSMLDDGELAKWKYISVKLNKATNKYFSPKECRDMVRCLFWSNPLSFEVHEEVLNECIKEKRMTRKSFDHDIKNSNELMYSQRLLDNHTSSISSASTGSSATSGYYTSSTDNTDYKSTPVLNENNSYEKNYY